VIAIPGHFHIPSNETMSVLAIAVLETPNRGPQTAPAPVQAQLSLRDVYRDHYRTVWMSLRRLGVREDDVADATQEVFLVVHRKLAEFEGRSQLKTWLFGISMRVARDRRRKASFRLETSSDQLDAEAARGTLALAQDAHAERNEARKTLEKVLEEMSPVHRVVFIMFELEGSSGEEIAETLGLPIGTVRSRLRLARETFERSAARIQLQARTHV
jgi:RNA polymerase sigma-70 factor, ECF subfamily